MPGPDLNNSKTIMVVDDDESVTSFLTFALKEEGFKVLEAHDAIKALALLKNFLPDLILLDIMMPQMDGLAMCRTLRAEPRTAKVPVIFITAYADPEKIKQIKEVGAQGLIEKPFMYSELLSQIMDALAGRLSLPTRLKFAS